MPRAVVAGSFAALVLVAGCKATGGQRPLALLHRVQHDVKAEMHDAVTSTRRAAAQTWADVWHDWNYTEQDGFSEIRTVSGM